MILENTGDIKKTGYGELPVYKTDAARPADKIYCLGIHETDTPVPDYIPKDLWLWVLGPDWEGMFYTGHATFSYTDLCGGIQNR